MLSLFVFYQILDLFTKVWKWDLIFGKNSQGIGN